MLYICYSQTKNNSIFPRAAQQAAAALAANTNAGDRKGPPPLLRSRTLPSIIVPGIAILQNQIDSSRLVPGMEKINMNFYFTLRTRQKRFTKDASNNSNNFNFSYLKLDHN